MSGIESHNVNEDIVPHNLILNINDKKSNNKK